MESRRPLAATARTAEEHGGAPRPCHVPERPGFNADLSQMHLTVFAVLALPFSSLLSLPMSRWTIHTLRPNHPADAGHREVGAGQLHGCYSCGVLRFLVRTLHPFYAGVQKFGEGY